MKYKIKKTLNAIFYFLLISLIISIAGFFSFANNSSGSVIQITITSVVVGLCIIAAIFSKLKILEFTTRYNMQELVQIYSKRVYNFVIFITGWGMLYVFVLNGGSITSELSNAYTMSIIMVLLIPFIMVSSIIIREHVYRIKFFYTVSFIYGMLISSPELVWIKYILAIMIVLEIIRMMLIITGLTIYIPTKKGELDLTMSLINFKRMYVATEENENE